MSSIKVKNQLNQIITISITATIFLFTLMFIIWTYNTDKQEGSQRLRDKLIEIKKTTDGLSKVKRLKLKALVKSISNSSMLKAALATSHEATISDTLNNMKSKNNLDFILILKNKKIIFSDSETTKKDQGLKETTAGVFIGAEKVGDNTILIGKGPTLKEISSWSDITGSKFILKRKNNDLIVKNYDKVIIQRINNSIDNFTPDNKYIIGHQFLLKGSLEITHLYPTAEYKKSFLRKRNRIIVFGITLSFIGFILSIFLSKIIIRVIKNSHHTTKETEFIEILEEIRLLKKKLL